LKKKHKSKKDLSFEKLAIIFVLPKKYNKIKNVKKELGK